MKPTTAFVLLAAVAAVAAPGPSADLKKDGAFAFLQADATVLCDTQELRLSAWSDSKHLYIQAVVWGDDSDVLGETEDGRRIGDSAVLCLDADSDGKITANVDRHYMLNPWPQLPGLRYSVLLGGGSSTHIKSDSKGRGAIRYLDHAGKKVRVDSFVVPLAEFGRKPGDKVRLAYWASSPATDLTLNSVGYQSPRKKYYSHVLPHEKYHEFALADRAASLDVSRVPDGHDDKVPVTRKPTRPAPKVGTVPPALAAADWINAEQAPTLAGLKGKVVVADFWATWCGPCIKGIPRLNALHKEHGAKGLVILGITEQSRQGIENFMKQTRIDYVVGAGSEMGPEYGVEGLPHAFVIGRDGKLLWAGDPGDSEFEKLIIAALKAK